MYVLRTLSIHDAVGALKWRQLRLALRISQNLYSKRREHDAVSLA
jgi:hypothetical protein